MDLTTLCTESTNMQTIYAAIQINFTITSEHITVINRCRKRFNRNWRRVCCKTDKQYTHL